MVDGCAFLGALGGLSSTRRRRANAAHDAARGRVWRVEHGLGVAVCKTCNQRKKIIE